MASVLSLLSDWITPHHPNRRARVTDRQLRVQRRTNAVHTSLGAPTNDQTSPEDALRARELTSYSRVHPPDRYSRDPHRCDRQRAPYVFARAPDNGSDILESP